MHSGLFLTRELLAGQAPASFESAAARKLFPLDRSPRRNQTHGDLIQAPFPFPPSAWSSGKTFVAEICLPAIPTGVNQRKQRVACSGRVGRLRPLAICSKYVQRTSKRYRGQGVPRHGDSNEDSTMLSMQRIVSLVVILLVCGLSALAGTWKTIDVPGSSSTSIYGINTAGDMAGTYLDAAGIQHGFLFKEGSFTTIDVPGAAFTSASGINDSGVITGTFSDSNGHGFLFDGTNYTTLDYPLAEFTYARGINNAGQVVGSYHSEADGLAHGFIWSDGTFTTLDPVPQSVQTTLAGINNRGKILGFYIGKRGEFFFLASADGVVHKFPADMSVSGLNDRRMIVGTVDRPSEYGFRYNLGTKAVHKLTFPGAKHETFPCGINNSGQIVGFYLTDMYHGFLWSP